MPGSEFDRWIDEGDAVDIRCDGDPVVIRRSLEGLGAVDVAVQGGPRPIPRIFVADMDSTIIGQECIDELADYAGVKAEVSAVTERAMKGELDFAGALAERVALLKGLDRDALAKCRRARIRPNPGAETLVSTLNKVGVSTNIVSGGFTDFVQPLACKLRFQGMKANHLGFDGDKLDGTTIGPVVDGEAKREFAGARLKDAGAGPEQLVAIGDGANDRGMIELAGLGIGYRPKPALDEVANAAIRHHDLTAVLWMMGIPRSDWIILPKPGSRAGA